MEPRMRPPQPWQLALVRQRASLLPLQVQQPKGLDLSDLVRGHPSFYNQRTIRPSYFSLSSRQGIVGETTPSSSESSLILMEGLLVLLTMFLAFSSWPARKQATAHSVSNLPSSLSSSPRRQASRGRTSQFISLMKARRLEASLRLSFSMVWRKALFSILNQENSLRALTRSYWSRAMNLFFTLSATSSIVCRYSEADPVQWSLLMISMLSSRSKALVSKSYLSRFWTCSFWRFEQCMLRTTDTNCFFQVLSSSSLRPCQSWPEMVRAGYAKSTCRLDLLGSKLGGREGLTRAQRIGLLRGDCTKGRRNRAYSKVSCPYRIRTLARNSQSRTGSVLFLETCTTCLEMKLVSWTTCSWSKSLRSMYQSTPSRLARLGSPVLALRLWYSLSKMIRWTSSLCANRRRNLTESSVWPNGCTSLNTSSRLQQCCAEVYPCESTSLRIWLLPSSPSLSTPLAFRNQTSPLRAYCDSADRTRQRTFRASGSYAFSTDLQTSADTLRNARYKYRLLEYFSNPRPTASSLLNSARWVQRYWLVLGPSFSSLLASKQKTLLYLKSGVDYSSFSRDQDVFSASVKAVSSSCQMYFGFSQTAFLRVWRLVLLSRLPISWCSIMDRLESLVSRKGKFLIVYWRKVTMGSCSASLNRRWLPCEKESRQRSNSLACSGVFSFAAMRLRKVLRRLSRSSALSGPPKCWCPSMTLRMSSSDRYQIFLAMFLQISLRNQRLGPRLVLLRQMVSARSNSHCCLRVKFLVEASSRYLRRWLNTKNWSPLIVSYSPIAMALQRLMAKCSLRQPGFSLIYFAMAETQVRVSRSSRLSSISAKVSFCRPSLFLSRCQFSLLKNAFTAAWCCLNSCLKFLIRFMRRIKPITYTISSPSMASTGGSSFMINSLFPTTQLWFSFRISMPALRAICPTDQPGPISL